MGFDQLAEAVAEAIIEVFEPLTAAFSDPAAMATMRSTDWAGRHRGRPSDLGTWDHWLTSCQPSAPQASSSSNTAGAEQLTRSCSVN